MGDDPGLPGPTDAWLTLAALARETSRIRLGTLVTLGHVPAARPAGGDGRPGRPDERRPGRAGHRRRLVRARAHRVRHPVPARRRALRPARRAAGDRSPGCGAPRPARRTASPASTTGWSTRPRCPSRCSVPGPPVIVGGRGPKRTPELAARYADEFNMPFKTRGRDRRGVRAGAGGVRPRRAGRDRPRAAGRSPPGSWWRSAAPTPRRSAGPRRCTSRARCRRRTRWSAPPRSSSTGSASSPRSAPPGCTCA